MIATQAAQLLSTMSWALGGASCRWRDAEAEYTQDLSAELTKVATRSLGRVEEAQVYEEEEGQPVLAGASRKQSQLATIQVVVEDIATPGGAQEAAALAALRLTSTAPEILAAAALGLTFSNVGTGADLVVPGTNAAAVDACAFTVEVGIGLADVDTTEAARYTIESTSFEGTLISPDGTTQTITWATP
jgi:hypothetical protein